MSETVMPMVSTALAWTGGLALLTAPSEGRTKK
jgi:hypothetical protein